MTSSSSLRTKWTRKRCAICSSRPSNDTSTSRRPSKASAKRPRLRLDNLTNRDYYETQNHFESRVTPDAPIAARIHGTPGYPLTAALDLTFRLRGK